MSLFCSSSTVIRSRSLSDFTSPRMSLDSFWLLVALLTQFTNFISVVGGLYVSNFAALLLSDGSTVSVHLHLLNPDESFGADFSKLPLMSSYFFCAQNFLNTLAAQTACALFVGFSITFAKGLQSSLHQERKTFAISISALDEFTE